MLTERNSGGVPVHILLIEDDDIDTEAVIRAFKKHNIQNPITVVTNGIDALNVLRGENDQKRLPRPYIILVDINMPRMNGLEFLKEIREDEQLKKSIIFVLTTSDRDDDKIAAYNQHVAGYVLKSRVGKDFAKMIKLLESYECMVEFPPEVNS